MRLLSLATFAVVLVALCACEESGTPRDGAGEGAADARVDLSADSTRDGPKDAKPDLLGDLPPFEASADVLTSDAALSPGTALYAVAGNNTDEIGLRTVSIDGSGVPQSVAGFSGLVDFDALDLSQLKLYLDVDPTRANVHPDSPLAGIRLPGGLGDLFYFHRKLTGTSGLLHVASDGKLSVLLEVFGLYQDVIKSRIGLSRDGKLGLAVEAQGKLHAFRTDGSTFSNGKASLQLSLPSELTTVVDRSLTIAGSYALVVAAGDTGARKLLRGPLDGSSAMAVVSLPQSDGADPTYVSDALAVSADDGTVAFSAGKSSSAADVYVVRVASGSATNVSRLPAQIAPRGPQLGFFSALLALSPDGSRVAYVARGGSDELAVVDTSGSASIVNVTSDARFDAGVGSVLNLLWVSNDDLLFMAGVTSTQLDLYRFDAKAAQVQSVTKRGGSSAPFNGFGELSARGIWRSPNGKWLYLIGYETIAAESLFYGVELATFTAKLVQQVGGVDTSSGSFRPCPSDSTMYYVGIPDANLDQEEVYRFDQDTASTPTRLTAFSSPTRGRWRSEDLTLDASCSTLIFSGGGNLNLRTFFRLAVAPAGPAQQLTAVPRYFDDVMAFSPDGASAVFASGGASDTSTLRAIPLAGGPPTVLDPVAGFVRILRVY
ncbi:MAG: hypothetical protein KC503_35395 [Myxococcales bacterium]|nr:hypothetical protein [Myxococcales bacterium]